MDNLAGYLIKVPESPVIVVGVGVECLDFSICQIPTYSLPSSYLAGGGGRNIIIGA